MIRYLQLICLVCVLTTSALAQQFPAINGETVADKKTIVPADLAGKRAVIGIAFSLKADDALKKWSQPLYDQLIAGGMGGLMGGNMYNANICFVAMLRGVAKLGLGELKQRSQKNIDKKLHSYFVISDDDAQKIIETLKVSDKNEPYFFVVDEKGNILFSTSGAYSEKKMNQITDALLN